MNTSGNTRENTRDNAAASDNTRKIRADYKKNASTRRPCLQNDYSSRISPRILLCVYFCYNYNYGDSHLIHIILLIGNMFTLPCISQATTKPCFTKTRPASQSVFSPSGLEVETARLHVSHPADADGLWHPSPHVTIDCRTGETSAKPDMY